MARYPSFGNILINIIIHTKVTDTASSEVHIHHDPYTSMCLRRRSDSFASVDWFFSASRVVSSSVCHSQKEKKSPQANVFYDRQFLTLGRLYWPECSCRTAIVIER